MNKKNIKKIELKISQEVTTVYQGRDVIEDINYIMKERGK